MKETKAKKSTYLRNFIIAVALSAAILAAGALWVLLGWRSALDITLTDLAGDPAALRGFTMRGQSYFDTAHTYWDLHDGYLDTGFALDPDSIDDQNRYSAWGASIDTLYAVAPKAVMRSTPKPSAYTPTKTHIRCKAPRPTSASWPKFTSAAAFSACPCGM